MDNRLFGMDLVDWVVGTISKYENNEDWNDAWLNTYKELGGSSIETGKKSCPKNAARILYQNGRIKGQNIEYKSVSLQEKSAVDSVNGMYALMAIEELSKKSGHDLKTLIEIVHDQYGAQFGSRPITDQGAIELSYKLWRLNKIVCKQEQLTSQ